MAWKAPRNGISTSTAAKLTIGQAATIAAITKNPAKYDPSEDGNLKEAQNQRDIVLDLMLQEGYISRKQHDEAQSVPLKDMLDIQDVIPVARWPVMPRSSAIT